MEEENKVSVDEVIEEFKDVDLASDIDEVRDIIQEDIIEESDKSAFEEHAHIDPNK